MEMLAAQVFKREIAFFIRISSGKSDYKQPLSLIWLGAVSTSIPDYGTSMLKQLLQK